MATNYWMLVSSADNFETTKKHGFKVQGIKSRHRKKAERMQPGDRILYYLTGVQAFGGTATITSPYWEDHAPIWDSKKAGEDYPFRVQVEPNVVLEPGEYLPAEPLAHRMEYTKRWAPEHWHLAFQGNVHALSAADFEMIEEALKRAAVPAGR